MSSSPLQLKDNEIKLAVSASFFLEFWKRRQAEIEYEWDVADFEEGEVIVYLK